MKAAQIIFIIVFSLFYSTVSSAMQATNRPTPAQIIAHLALQRSRGYGIANIFLLPNYPMHYPYTNYQFMRPYAPANI